MELTIICEDHSVKEPKQVEERIFILEDDILSLAAKYLPEYLEPLKYNSNLAEAPVMQKIAGIVDIYGLECPNSSNCGNKGTLAEHGCDGSQEDCERTCPVPVQCEFCYCEPRSKFNLENDLKEMFINNPTK